MTSLTPVVLRAIVALSRSGQMLQRAPLTTTDYSTRGPRARALSTDRDTCNRTMGPRFCVGAVV